MKTPIPTPGYTPQQYHVRDFAPGSEWGGSSLLGGTTDSYSPNTLDSNWSDEPYNMRAGRLKKRKKDDGEENSVVDDSSQAMSPRDQK